MSLLPNDPDELDEIKNLLENSVTNPQSSSAPVPAGSEHADSAAPAGTSASEPDALSDIDLLPAVETPVLPASKTISSRSHSPSLPDSPAIPQKTGTDRLGSSAVPQKSGARRSGPPAVIKKNSASRPGPPAVPQKPETSRPDPPAVPQSSGVSRSRSPAANDLSNYIDSEPNRKVIIKKPGMEITFSQSELTNTSPVNDGNLSADESLIIPYKPPPRSDAAGRDDPELDTGSDKFKMKFDFDDEYIDVPERKPIRWRRERRTGCIGGILYAAFVISVSLLLASLIWMAAVDVLGLGTEDEQINVHVPQGFEIEDITEILYDAGLIRYKFLFNIYAGYSSAKDKITAGSYVLNTNYDYRMLVQGMTARVGKRVETTVTIPEGFTLAQIFALLDDYGVCPAEDLWEAAKNHDFKYSFLDKSTLGDELRLEGFLFPETYNFYVDSTPAQAITTFLREFNKRFTEQYTERAEFMEYSVRDIITIASMIEREAGDDEERPRIAAVIYNRLDSGDYPNLQIDATIHYAIAGTGRAFSTDIDSPYNTYICEGLPPGPISNPGIASIRAALYPESTNEYYYALNRSGTHDFFRTLAQQQAFVQSDEYGGR